MRTVTEFDHLEIFPIEDFAESYCLRVGGCVTKSVQFGAFLDAVGKVGMPWLLVNPAP